MSFPPNFDSVKIGDYIAKEAKQLASQIIDNAKKDVTNEAKALLGQGWDSEDLEGEVFVHSRQKVRAAFKDFETTLEAKYKDSQDRRVTATMRLAILDGKSRFFSVPLQKALAEVMEKVLAEGTKKEPPEDPTPGMMKV